MFAAEWLATTVNEVVVFIYLKGTEKQRKMSRHYYVCCF